MRAIHTDFSGYEGMYVATDQMTGEVLLAYKDPRTLLREAKKHKRAVVHGRVPRRGELRQRIG